MISHHVFADHLDRLEGGLLGAHGAARVRDGIDEERNELVPETARKLNRRNGCNELRGDRAHLVLRGGQILEGLANVGRKNE